MCILFFLISSFLFVVELCVFGDQFVARWHLMGDDCLRLYLCFDFFDFVCLAFLLI